MTVLDSFRLDGRRALVTGGGGGIGSAISVALAEAGADVAVLDLDLGVAESVAARARESGRRGFGIRCDVTDPAAVEEAVDEAVKALGGLEIAVNNAGIATNTPATEMSAEEWDRVIAVNLRGVFLCSRKAGKVMLANGTPGSILNTASMSARIVNHPQPQCSYNASKAGVVQLTRSLASEWAPQGIRVNSLSPGYVNTPLNERSEIAHLRDRWVDMTPLARMAEVEDLTGPAVFLVSDAARYMTGHDLVVDGGYTLR